MKKPTSSQVNYSQGDMMMREIISKLLDTDILSGVQTKILKEYLVYGKTEKEIAPLFNLTYYRVKQIIESAYAILKSKLSANQELFYTLKKQQGEIEELRNNIAKKDQKENQFKSLPKKTQKLLSKKIEMLPLDKRIINSFIHHDIYLLRDLVKLKKREFTTMRNIGSKSINEMEEFLLSKGLTWGMEI